MKIIERINFIGPIQYAVLCSILVLWCSAFAYPPLDCNSIAPGFIPIPKNEDLGTYNFCVMQFEARASKVHNQNTNVNSYEIKINGCRRRSSGAPGSEDCILSHIPVSTPIGLPWTNIHRNNAIQKCQQLNDEYQLPKNSELVFDLISNEEWQAIARNIEAQNTNWSTAGMRGQWCLNQGNNGRDTFCSYNGDDPEQGDNPKARHILSNGEFIYHVSGNVSEWVKGRNVYKGKEGGRPMSIYKYRDSLLRLSPKYSYFHCDKLNSFCGLGYYMRGKGAPRRAIIRGGYSRDGYSGVFSVNLSFGPLISFYSVGFRCVLRPRVSRLQDDPGHVKISLPPQN